MNGRGKVRVLSFHLGFGARIALKSSGGYFICGFLQWTLSEHTKICCVRPKKISSVSQNKRDFVPNVILKYMCVHYE